MNLKGNLFIPTDLLSIDHLNKSSILLYSIILNCHFNETGCILSNNSLAELVGIKERALASNLSLLKAKGFISIEYNKDFYGYRQRKIIPLKYTNTTPNMFYAND